MVPEAHHGVVSPDSSVLHIEASPDSLAAGGSAVVRGTLQDAGGTALSGLQVLLQARRFSQTAFSDVATLTTGADGAFSQPVTPIAGTEYRVVYKGAASVSTVQRPAIARASITVKQTVRLAARPRSVRRGAKVKILGTVAPTAQQLGATASAVTLRVERKSPSGWRKVAGRTLAPRADGTFSWSWRPRKAGAYRVRATAAAVARAARRPQSVGRRQGALTIDNARPPVRRVQPVRVYCRAPSRGSLRAPHPAPLAGRQGPSRERRS